MHPRFRDITGMKFNRLTVIEKHDSRNGRVRWLCKCDCGANVIVRSYNIRTGKAKSCGCYSKENSATRVVAMNRTHGLSKTRFYNIWLSMRKRCYDPNHEGYKNYGGRGIVVCVRWKNAFENFRNDMYSSYISHCSEHGEFNTTLDRIDSNRSYEPDNCRWATWEVQGKNRRK